MENSAYNFIGRYIVTDPKICHGKPTFRGTRIMVADVLEQVAEGLAWESIIEGWHNSISKDAIAEALQSGTFIFRNDLKSCQILLESDS